MICVILMNLLKHLVQGTSTIIDYLLLNKWTFRYHMIVEILTVGPQRLMVVGPSVATPLTICDTLNQIYGLCVVTNISPIQTICS